jgi:acetyltransferase-like isoleucine patch superfamily enzyme
LNTKRLLVVGTSGYANEVGYIIRRIDPDGAIWNPLSYVAASRSEIGEARLFGRVEYCDEDVLSSDMSADAIIALGDPQLRHRVASRYIKVSGLAFPNVIDPSVDLDRTLVTMGIGNVLHRNVMTTFNLVMGDFNFLNKGCIIGHDVRLGSFNTVNPLASLLSNSRLGDGCLIGAAANVLPKVSIADRTTLGAGALLRHDIEEAGQVFVGIPAKKLR